MKYRKFLQELDENEKIVSEYLFDDNKKLPTVSPSIIEECTLAYLKRGGKKLRPAILMLCCKAMGGNKELALPAAAAVELFHTWTLVHDDIIDKDDLRRGVPTVHKTAENYALEKFNFTKSQSQKYGNDVAILTGDIQHGWAISMLSRNLMSNGVKPEVILHLISLLQVEMLRTLVEGEMLDVNFSLFYDINDLEEDDILDMLWKKTGVFYEFCGLAGALIGQNSLEMTDKVKALKEFCSLCGTAFQIRDDILGLIGKEDELGKPVGSDIREGKQTILLKEATKNADSNQLRQLKNIVGNPDATEREITKITELIINLNGVERAHSIALKYVEKAIPLLDIIESSDEKDLLIDWANYMIDRKY